QTRAGTLHDGLARETLRMLANLYRLAIAELAQADQAHALLLIAAAEAIGVKPGKARLSAAAGCGRARVPARVRAPCSWPWSERRRWQSACRPPEKAALSWRKLLRG